MVRVGSVILASVKWRALQGLVKTVMPGVKRSLPKLAL